MKNIKYWIIAFAIVLGVSWIGPAPDVADAGKASAWTLTGSASVDKTQTFWVLTNDSASASTARLILQVDCLLPDGRFYSPTFSSPVVGQVYTVNTYGSSYCRGGLYDYSRPKNWAVIPTVTVYLT